MSLIRRIGYRDGYELRARTDGVIERVDHDAFLQLVVGRDTSEVIVRIEEPGREVRAVVLGHDEGASGVAIVVGPLYLGGRLRVRETIDEAGEAERRWAQSALSSCWVSGPAPGCC
ncbi:MAG: hypothetical protein U0353_12530 [Sandaracinus sp.]